MKTKKPEKQKSRAKHQCPPKLADYLQKANLVDPAVQLQNSSEVMENFREIESPNGGPLKFGSVGYNNMLVNSFDELTRDFSDDTKNAVLKLCLQLQQSKFPEYDREFLRSASYLLAITNWYADLRELRISLQEIAEYFAQLRKGEVPIPKLPYVGSRIELDGTIARVNLIGLASAIDGVDLDRIRKCEMCSRLFWAKRSDSKTCSAPCLNKLNIKKSRNRTPEEKEVLAAARKTNRTTVKRLRRNGGGS